jgi:hypothetical protein
MNLKGVTRWSSTTGNEIYTIGAWEYHNFGDRTSSIDREIMMQRVPMDYPNDAVLLPAAYKFLVGKDVSKHALTMKLPNQGLHSGMRFMMWVHMPGQTQNTAYGSGVRMTNSGVWCKISADMDSSYETNTFDMVYFSEELNAAFVLNEDNAIVLVSDVIVQQDGKLVLVVEYIKKITEKASDKVHDHVMRHFQAMWREGKFADAVPSLEPTEFIEEHKAKRAKLNFEVPESPAVRIRTGGVKDLA